MKAAKNEDEKKIRKDIIVCGTFTFTPIFLSYSAAFALNPLPQLQSATDPTLRVVRFHILQTLPDSNPIIVDRERQLISIACLL